MAEQQAATSEAKVEAPKMLLSFINSVAVMVDGRTFHTHSVICEEIFGAKVDAGPKADKETPAERKAFWKNWRNSPPMRAPLDFPLYVRVISLGDGKPLSKIYPMIVKYNNVSAIMEL